MEDKIDPLRRVFVPRETRTPKGTLVFRTMDDCLYARTDDGAIRRAYPKARGKSARAVDKANRRMLRRAATRREVMGDPKDPRIDRHPNDGTPGKSYEPPDNSRPKDAPGGVGTGTKDDPAKAPAAQPKP